MAPGVPMRPGAPGMPMLPSYDEKYETPMAPWTPKRPGVPGMPMNPEIPNHRWEMPEQDYESDWSMSSHGSSMSGSMKQSTKDYNFDLSGFGSGNFSMGSLSNVDTPKGEKSMWAW